MNLQAVWNIHRTTLRLFLSFPWGCTIHQSPRKYPFDPRGPYLVLSDADHPGLRFDASPF
jgi:hypothetical protein